MNRFSSKAKSMLGIITLLLLFSFGVVLSASESTRIWGVLFLVMGLFRLIAFVSESRGRARLRKDEAELAQMLTQMDDTESMPEAQPDGDDDNEDDGHAQSDTP